MKLTSKDQGNIPGDIPIGEKICWTKLNRCPGNRLWALNLAMSISDPPNPPNTSVYTVIFCVLLVPQCVSFYISINICRRPPNTSLLLMAAQPRKKRKKNLPDTLLYTSSSTHRLFIFPWTHTHTHWPLMSGCVGKCSHLKEEFSGHLWDIPWNTSVHDLPLDDTEL